VEAQTHEKIWQLTFKNLYAQNNVALQLIQIQLVKKSQKYVKIRYGVKTLSKLSDYSPSNFSRRIIEEWSQRTF